MAKKIVEPHREAIYKFVEWRLSHSYKLTMSNTLDILENSSYVLGSIFTTLKASQFCLQKSYFYLLYYSQECLLNMNDENLTPNQLLLKAIY